MDASSEASVDSRGVITRAKYGLKMRSGRKGSWKIIVTLFQGRYRRFRPHNLLDADVLMPLSRELQMNRKPSFMPCGKIIAFFGDVAILCTNHDRHEGPHDSEIFRFLVEREFVQAELKVL